MKERILLSIPMDCEYLAEKSVDELLLTAKTRQCLKSAKICTVGEIIDIINHNELIKVRNIGKRGYKETIDAIKTCLGYQTVYRIKFRFKIKFEVTCNPELIDTSNLIKQTELKKGINFIDHIYKYRIYEETLLEGVNANTDWIEDLRMNLLKQKKAKEAEIPGIEYLEIRFNGIDEITKIGEDAYANL